MVPLPPARIDLRPSIPSREYLLVLIAIASLFLFLFGPALRSEFYIVEDHGLVTRASWGVTDWVTRIADDAQSFGRFRPVYWLYTALGGQLFRTDAHIWHAATIWWGVLTCYLFYIALRKIGADIISSFIFVLLLVLSGNQNWIWINLIPQETIGMLLTALTVWALILASQRSQPGRWDTFAITAMTLAGLTKESFVILMPALLLLRWTCQKCFGGQSWRGSLRQIRLPLTIGALVFVIEIAIVMAVLLSHPGGYSAGVSGLSIASFDPRRWLQIFATLKWYQQLVLAAGVLLWIILWFDKRLNRTCLLASAVLLAVWLVPQIVLYTNGLNERYLFPAIASVAATLALGLAILWQRRLWPLWAISVLLLLPILVNGVKSTTSTVSWFTAETLAANRLITFLAQNIPADQSILMAGDSATPYGFEATYALPVYLKMAGSNSPFYLWPLVAQSGQTAMHVAASKNNAAFHYPESLSPREVGAIIIVDTFVPGLDFKPLSKWLNDTAWREISFTEHYYAFSIPEFKYVEAGEVSHMALIPLQTATDIPSASPLITIDPSLRGVVNTSPFLDVPAWGIEHDFAGPGSIVWLGQGETQGFGGTLWSTQEQPVEITFGVVPGPGRPDYQRIVEFGLDNRTGQQTQRKVIESENWDFKVTLQPGVNRFKLMVLDEVTVPVQPNGDTRPLLALLRHMTVTLPAGNSQ